MSIQYTIAMNLPAEFLARLSQIVPTEKYDAVLTSFCEDKPVTFRVNSLKSESVVTKNNLVSQGFQLQSIPWYKDAFILANKTKTELQDTAEYKNGDIYIQNLSSMIPALILDPKPGETVGDIAASPGSKTTQIAALMENQGQIIANDLSRQRLFKLKDNLTNLGVTNTTIINFPGQMLWRRYPEYFDKILVDVPCSLEGEFHSDNPKTYAGWSTKKVKTLSKLQKYLLWSAVSMTKVGGTIVYSTCTLSPEENEEVVSWILKKTAGSLVVESINLDIAEKQTGLTQWGNKNFDAKVENTLRILPSKTMEGFFVAKLGKVSSSQPISPDTLQSDQVQ